LSKEPSFSEKLRGFARSLKDLVNELRTKINIPQSEGGGLQRIRDPASLLDLESEELSRRVILKSYLKKRLVPLGEVKILRREQGRKRTIRFVGIGGNDAYRFGVTASQIFGQPATAADEKKLREWNYFWPKNVREGGSLPSFFAWIGVKPKEAFYDEVARLVEWERKKEESKTKLKELTTMLKRGVIGEREYRSRSSRLLINPPPHITRLPPFLEALVRFQSFMKIRKEIIYHLIEV